MWQKIYIQSNQIEGWTGNGVLIKMPNNSEYKKFTFWHPKKLVKPVGRNSYLIELVFNEEFEFKLKRHGQGKNNFSQVIAEKTIDTNEFKRAFGFSVDENLLEDLREED